MLHRLSELYKSYTFYRAAWRSLFFDLTCRIQESLRKQQVLTRVVLRSKSQERAELRGGVHFLMLPVRRRAADGAHLRGERTATRHQRSPRRAVASGSGTRERERALLCSSSAAPPPPMQRPVFTYKALHSKTS